MTTPAPISEERLNELIAGCRNNCNLLVYGECRTRACQKKDDKDALVLPLELVGCEALHEESALRELLSLRRAKPAEGGEASDLPASVLETIETLRDVASYFHKEAEYERENMGNGGSQIALGRWTRFYRAIEYIADEIPAARRNLDELAAVREELRVTREANEWRPIETAPRGGGAAMVDDPAWIDPPDILLLFPPMKKAGAAQAVGVWDWYYAPDGGGYAGCSAWISPAYGDLLAMYYGEPTHWRPLPAPPDSSGGK